MGAVFFGFAIFVGWFIIDWSKEKQIHMSQLLGSLVAGVVGAAGWALFDWIF